MCDCAIAPDTGNNFLMFIINITRKTWALGIFGLRCLSVLMLSDFVVVDLTCVSDMVDCTNVVCFGDEMGDIVAGGMMDEEVYLIGLVVEVEASCTGRFCTISEQILSPPLLFFFSSVSLSDEEIRSTKAWHSRRVA
jgi:hypothetical protein